MSEYIDAPWEPGTLLYREENGERYYGHVVPAAVFGVASLDGRKVGAAETQSEAMRSGWQPWIANGSSDADLIVPATTVKRYAKEALHLRESITNLERGVQRSRADVESIRTDLRNFKQAVAREVRAYADDEPDDEQEKLYGLLGRIGFEVSRRHTVRVTLSVTVDVRPEEEWDDDDVRTALREDEYDILTSSVQESEWVVDF